MISVIIPVINEANNITKISRDLLDNSEIEIIVVDGGSQDETVKIARQLGLKVISSERGRAKQMNFGASVARGEILLFLHADTQLPLGFEKLVIQALFQPQIVAGAFSLQIASKMRGIRLIEKMTNVRSRLFQLPYGDQAIFISQDWFNKVGGFPDLPIMEDFELILRLKKLGKIAIISNPVITSARRWEKLGVWKTTWINQQIIMAYFLGISPLKIASWYRAK
jgi:rSAM/selenodomain-associated transferase 2